MAGEFFDIVLRDELRETWTVWFEGLCIDRIENHATCLSGEVVDYSAQ